MGGRHYDSQTAKRLREIRIAQFAASSSAATNTTYRLPLQPELDAVLHRLSLDLPMRGSTTSRHHRTRMIRPKPLVPTAPAHTRRPQRP